MNTSRNGLARLRQLLGEPPRREEGNEGKESDGREAG